MKLYKYIGPDELLKLVDKNNTGKNISSTKEVISWLDESNKILDELRQITVTFVINKHRNLLIADRHSEHVVCAGGEDLLSAGELTFQITNGTVEIISITNQSTGYCPEPSSWKAVENALKSTDLKYPSGFTIKFEFRKCDYCNTIVLIKDDWYECYECGSELNNKWNF